MANLGIPQNTIAVLQKYHFNFQKKFGQNFLIDPHVLEKIVEAAGVTKEISPHSFRHSFATHLIANGADLRVVQEMLGHESILTTELYTHIDAGTWQKSILEHHPRKKGN